MKKTVKTIVKLLGSALCALLFAVNAVPGMDMVLELPDDIYVEEPGARSGFAAYLHRSA